MNRNGGVNNYRATEESQTRKPGKTQQQKTGACLEEERQEAGGNRTTEPEGRRKRILQEKDPQDREKIEEADRPCKETTDNLEIQTSASGPGKVHHVRDGRKDIIRRILPVVDNF